MEYIRVPKLLLELGLSHRQPRNNVWITKRGIQLIGDSGYGVPFGQVRSILLYLIARIPSSGIKVQGSIADVLQMFDCNQQRATLGQHFERLTRCHYGVIASRKRSSGPENGFEHRRLDFIEAAHYCPTTGMFTVVFSESFAEQTRKGTRCSFAVIKRLVRANQLAALDLYLWYEQRLASSERTAVDPFGPNGPYGPLAIADNTSKRRKALRDRHAIVAEVWPACPFRITGTGSATAINLDGMSQLDPGLPNTIEIARPDRPPSKPISPPVEPRRSAVRPRRRTMRIIPAMSSPPLPRMPTLRSIEDARNAASQLRTSTRELARLYSEQSWKLASK